ncbi:PhoX family protein [Ochrovirga pacifica]|uniref:hypothetical protein n=1 Tax=Ochrovirga pacifica TaxID=1042376 RepID=UPI0002557B41|nr:hypothetical protein [Ochrovirga pacifica]
MKILKLPLLWVAMSLAAITISCGEDGLDGLDGKDGIDGVDGQNGKDGQDGKDAVTLEDTEMFYNKSLIEPLVNINPSFSNVKAYSLLTSVDVVGESNFQIASTVDGSGLIREDENGFIYVVNCEDAKAVARLRLDNNLNPISGDYLLNSGVADYSRQCSGTMWEKEIHGGDKDVFLSASEESISNVVKELDPRVETPNPTGDYGNKALGHFLWENAVPLPKNTYPGKTVILGGNDLDGGQPILYLSENGDADRTNGKVYVLRAKQISDGAGGVVAAPDGERHDESDFDLKQSYDIEFLEIPNAKNLSTGETSNYYRNTLFATHFVRMEDLDYQKGSDANARNIYFAVTGKGAGRGTVNDQGTVYKLELDEDSPLTGRLTKIISGNDSDLGKEGYLRPLQSPDNICVTENYVYIQEDPNGGTWNRGHAASIYQADLAGDNVKNLLDLKVKSLGNNSLDIVESGEFGSLIDVSDKVGVPGTFILNIQVKYWQDNAFKALDGHDGTGESDRASQIVILRGLPQ